jgi:protein-S-isoprenylcysteine O-methyltransferase Ste14
MDDNAMQQPRQITWTVLIVRFTIMYVLVAAILFATAGRIDWEMGWVYLLTLMLFTFAGRAIVMQRNPDMLAERAGATGGDDTKSWDKTLMPLVAIVIPIIMLAVTGLDFRFDWSPAVPLWVQIASWGVLVVGILVSTWAMIANRFFSSVVRIQTNRGHTVVTSGPYRFVRHPGYSGGVVANLVTPVMLGSLWALIPAVLLTALTIVRTTLEDRTLREELPGYADYIDQVPYRLIPFIW